MAGTRTMSAAMLAEIDNETVRPLLLAELDFSSGYVRVNSTERTVSFDSGTVPGGPFDFLGVGHLGKVSPVEEGIEQKSYGLVLQISGIISAYISTVLTEQYQGRQARLWLGFFDSSYALVASPMLIFAGRMDSTAIKLGGTAEITVTAENRLADWERPRVRRYTNEDQALEYPGDAGFEFVPAMLEKQLVWGRG